jgi:ketosteroid isomerase-like protein
VDDTKTVIEQILAYWCAQDVESTASLMADDIVYQLNVDETALPYGGTTRGVEALKTAMYQMHVDWNYLSTKVVFVSAAGSSGKAQVKFRYHHNKSGHVIDGTLRFVFDVRDGLVCRIEEYQDKAMFEAFLALSNVPPSSAR